MRKRAVQLLVLLLCFAAMYGASRLGLPWNAMAVLPAGFVALLIIDGWLSKSASKPHTVTTYVGSDSTRAVIFLPGLGNLASNTARPVEDVLLEYGDLIEIECPTGEFVRCSFCWDITEHAQNYKEVVLVGFSFGATMILEYLRHMRDRDIEPPITGVIAVDGPTCKADVKSPVIGLANYLDSGAILRRLWPSLQRAFYKLGPPVPLEELSGAQLAHQAKHANAMLHYPPAGYIAQAKIIANCQPLQPGEFAGIPCAVIDCTGEDVFVKEEASERWLAGFPRSALFYSGKGHAGPCEEPKATAAAVRQALSFLSSTTSPR